MHNSLYTIQLNHLITPTKSIQTLSILFQHTQEHLLYSKLSFTNSKTEYNTIKTNFILNFSFEVKLVVDLKYLDELKSKKC